jgi:NADPH-dependent curcumin reductase CurA
MTEHSFRELFLARRPEGKRLDNCFTMREVAAQPLAGDEVLVENKWMSVDPYMYLRAIAADFAGEIYEIGDVPDAFCVGKVLESSSERFRAGDLVLSTFGWREGFVAPASAVNPLPPGFDIPPQAYLSVLGAPALTAWVGMTQLVALQPGQTIFISGAAGGVGIVACQLALRAGLRVIASAGSEQKCAWLAGLGDVRTLNYRETPDILTALRKIAPEGLDLYFDNVGGNHLEAAIEHAKPKAHFIECGMISSFVTGGDPASLRVDIRRVPSKSITLHGYTVSHYLHLYGVFIDDMREWIRDGGVRVPEAIFEGLQDAPRALESIFGGGHFGRTLVRLS